MRLDEKAGAGGEARGGGNLTPPEIHLEDAPKDLIRDLRESGLTKEAILALLDTSPSGLDKRLTAPLAIRGRRGRAVIAELYLWAHAGGKVEDLIDELSYFTGVSQRTLRSYWDGIKRKGRVRESEGKVRRLEV